MRNKLQRSLRKIDQKLLSKRVNSKYIIIGIQGGKGSFNEEACRFYCQKHKIKNYKIKYLYTSNNVLRALNQGEIDYGQFAIQNVAGGVVRESIKALSKYNCKIVKEFKILIRHYLLAKPGIEIDKISKIMSHPQAFSQCKFNLKRKYPKKKLISGKGSLIDQAKACWALAKGKISNKIAILAPKICADLYKLSILDEDLQDTKDNWTTFLFVKR